MSTTNFKPSDFANLGKPSCSIWGKSELETIALAYVDALKNDGDTWKKLSRERTLELLTDEEQQYPRRLLRDDYYQRWFEIISDQIVDSDGALAVGGFWNLHRLEKQGVNAS